MSLPEAYFSIIETTVGEWQTIAALAFIFILFTGLSAVVFSGGKIGTSFFVWLFLLTGLFTFIVIGLTFLWPVFIAAVLFETIRDVFRDEPYGGFY